MDEQHRTQSPTLTRRETLAAGIAALASTLVPRVGRAATPLEKLNLTDAAVKRAQQQYLRDKTVDSFLTWTELLRDWGDYPQVRENLKQLLPYKAQWGRHDGRIVSIWRDVSFKDYQLTFTVRPDEIESMLQRHRNDGPWLVFALPQAITHYVPHARAAVENVAVQEWRTGWLGNKLLYVQPQPGVDPVVKCEWRCNPVHYRLDLPKWDPSPLPEDVKKHLGRTYRDGTPTSGLMIDPEGPICQRLVADLKTDNAPEALHRMFKLHVSMTWNEAPAEGDIHTELLFTKGPGHCAQGTVRSCAMARALGIPARMVRGWSVKVGHAKVGEWLQGTEQHSWPEFYLHGLGWCALDGGQPMWMARWPYGPRFRHEHDGPDHRLAMGLDRVRNDTMSKRIVGEWLEDGESKLFPDEVRNAAG
jgi:hypothetical protein